MREAGGQEGCHHRVVLDPNRYILDGRAGGKGRLAGCVGGKRRLARCVRQGVIECDLRHLDKFEF